jgi:ubiquinone/menaquinone biosynthesis C-methylase UbiE
MQDAYRKDMSHRTWDQVYERQKQRAYLAGDWIDALRLKAGDSVLDVGAGPGFMSVLLAERVGRGGLVYAVDPSAEALAFLERQHEERGLPKVKTIIADAAKVDLGAERVDGALVSMVLHHADDPAAILRNVQRLLRPGGRAVIAEFDPDGPGDHGPPPTERLARVQIRSWCEAAGLLTLEERQQSAEHYMFVVQRAGETAGKRSYGDQVTQS